MWRFLNTRPEARLEPLTSELRSVGIDVHNLPLLSFKAKPLSVQEQHALHHMATYDVIVCVSPTAAEYALDVIKYSVLQHEVSSVVWIAVGARTADVLAQQGISAYVPHQSSNEGMLLMPEIQKLNASHRVLILRGEGGRRLLIDELQQRNVRVDSIAFYQRSVPTNLKQQFTTQAMWANMVLISSGTSWENWQSVCTDILSYRYIVLGERLHQLVWHDVMQALAGKRMCFDMSQYSRSQLRNPLPLPCHRVRSIDVLTSQNISRALTAFDL